MTKTIWMTAAAGIVVAGLLAGCASTMQTRGADKSGFLGDYSKLQPGQSGQAQLVYFSPKANWKSYTKVKLDPIRVYATKDSDLGKVPREDLQGLVNYLDAALREQLSQDYQLVSTAGPGVLRMRVALTDAQGNKPVRGLTSTLMPIGLALSVVKTAATGTPMAVGSARVEAEFLDGQSNVRLAAIVDERAGRKVDVAGNFSKWDDVRDAFDFWAARTRERLAELRGGAR
ncbi:MAG: DUF3313 domain-containing protein [Lentisphaerae bacterium]|nr:DUF3313 domain-containing protein [Lentisphaerota bacterium]